MLKSSSATSYVPNEHEYVDKYDPYPILSELTPYQSYPESVLNHNEIPVDLSC